MRSSAVRPSSFSRLYCCAGRELVVEHHGVGVDREADLAQLLGLALADVPRVVGRVAALHQPADHVGAGGVDEQRELVEAGLGVVVGVAGQGDADEHDLLPLGALDERRAECLVVRSVHAGLRSSLHGIRPSTTIVTVAMYCAGPTRVTRPGDGWSQTYLGISAVHVHDDFRRRRRRRGPTGAAAHALAHAPVPQASVMPAPRSWTRMRDGVRLGPGSTISRFTYGHHRHRAPSRSTAATSSTPTTLCGLPRLRWRDRAHRIGSRRVPSRPGSAMAPTSPMSTAGR